jgi:uncharacterized protein (DUF488 family)
MPTIFTIGHSTRDLADFSRVLQAHEIRILVDIRAFPASRRHPHFNREHLELWLPEIGLDYVWEKDLGGMRKQQMLPEQSPNIALHEESFRNYADYMLSEQFRLAIERLVDLAAKRRTVMMCAEQNFVQCHRRFVSDYLAHCGHSVMHIVDESGPQQHGFSQEAMIVDGKLHYRGDYLL